MNRFALIRSFAATASCAAALAIAAPAAHAAFGITDFGGALTEPSTTTYEPDTGANVLGAGAHPDFTTSLEFPFKADDNGGDVPDGTPRNVSVTLPKGLTANPTVASTCSQDDLTRFFAAVCPVDSQVGVVNLEFGPGFGFGEYPLYNIDTPPGVPARFGFNVFQVPVQIDAVVKPGDGYALKANVTDIPQALAISRVKVTLWGVPADPVHDGSRYQFSPGGNTNVPASSSLARRAFVNNPTTCTGQVAFGVTAAPWEDPSAVVSATDSTQPDGAPFAFTGCDALAFAPTASVRPTTTTPDSPTGLDVSVSVPQSDSPISRAASHLKDLKLTLPPGMTVNPSAASGLGSCSSAQIGVNSPSDPACPANSKIGTVTLTTPLLDGTLSGDVFLAAQKDNPFGTLLGLYVGINDRGVLLKLPGRIDADQATGQLTATFADNPQLPFSKLDVRLNGGPRAPLSTPASCGTKTSTVDLAPWSGGPTQSATSSFAVDCTAGLGGFAPRFDAGTVSPAAALSSPLIVNIDRPDGQQELNQVGLTLPPGLLAKLRGVRQCTSAQAEAGTCDSLSRLGSAQVTAGSGSEPFSLGGDVFLTGPYKGAPFGLAVRVRAVAGPLDLGTVIVRQALFIDPEDTHVTVVSDPLPTILQGIPIKLRSLRVNVDRPGFALNPTSCEARSIGGTLGSPGGARAAVSARFQVGGCRSLRLKPRLNLRLIGKGSALRDGGHPSLKAILVQPGGQSNLRRAEVKLPLSLALDPDNAQTLCEFAEGRKSNPVCPKGSIVGTAKARTPLLNKTLSGPVYFVKGQRTDRRTGRVIRTLPTLVVPLSGEGVRINLRARTAVSRGRLVTTFDPIPDAPVSRFDLNLKGGKNGILVANTSVCSKSRTTAIGIRGQNLELLRTAPAIAASCK